MDSVCAVYEKTICLTSERVAQPSSSNFAILNGGRFAPVRLVYVAVAPIRQTGEIVVYPRTVQSAVSAAVSPSSALSGALPRGRTVRPKHQLATSAKLT